MDRTGTVKTSGWDELSHSCSTRTVDITLGLLRKLREMVEQGLVIVGARPHQTVGFQSYSIAEEKEFEQLCNELWGKNTTAMIDRNVGKGRVFWEASLNLNQVFRQIQLKPDFEVGDNPNSAPIRYIHRQIGDTMSTL